MVMVLYYGQHLIYLSEGDFVMWSIIPVHVTGGLQLDCHIDHERE